MILECIKALFINIGDQKIELYSRVEYRNGNGISKIFTGPNNES